MTNPRPDDPDDGETRTPSTRRGARCATVAGVGLVLVLLLAGTLAASVRTFSPRAEDEVIADVLTTEVRWDGTIRCDDGERGVSLTTLFTDEPDTTGAPMSVEVTLLDAPPDRRGGLATGAEIGRAETTAILEDGLITLDRPDDPGDLGLTGGELRVTTDPDRPDTLAGELQAATCEEADLVQVG